MPANHKLTFAFFAMLSLCGALLVPVGYGALTAGGSRLTVAATGPTLPPPPWWGEKTGPTLPPPPWAGTVA
jgi:hypothetical protein